MGLPFDKHELMRWGPCPKEAHSRSKSHVGLRSAGSSVREKREGVLQMGWGISWGRLIFDLSCNGGAELFRQRRAGKGISGRGSHMGKCSAVRNSCCICGVTAIWVPLE